MKCKKFQSPKIFLQGALGYKCIYFLCLIFQLFTLFLYLADRQAAHSWIHQAVCFSYISSKHIKSRAEKVASWCWRPSHLKSYCSAIFNLQISSCGPRWLLHFCMAASKKGKKNKGQAYSFPFNVTVTFMFIFFLTLVLRIMQLFSTLFGCLILLTMAVRTYLKVWFKESSRTMET